MANKDALEQKRVFAEEAAVVDAQTLLHSVMERKGISRADLARSMNVSRARVTQIFSDECTNFTVRLLARALYALGEDLVLLTKRDANELAGEKLLGHSALALSERNAASWTEIDDYSQCFETANDNMFDSIRQMRCSRRAYEEIAA